MEVGEIRHLNGVITGSSNTVQFRFHHSTSDSYGIRFDVVVANFISLQYSCCGATRLSVGQDVKNVLSVRTIADLIEYIGPGKVQAQVSVRGALHVRYPVDGGHNSSLGTVVIQFEVNCGGG